MAWVAAIVQGVQQGIMGGIQMGVSMDQLSKLPSAKSYSPATDLETATSMSRRAAQQGMTPQERAVAEQAIGTAQSRTQRAMEQRGLGNLAAAVSQIRTTEAYNQLEAQNQEIKRQSLGQYANLAGQIQSLQNQNISSFNQMLYAQQQALGQSARAGFSNLTMGIGESIASAVEGEDAVNKAALGGSDAVTTGQMGVTDSGIQTPTPEGFGLKSMEQGGNAIDTGLTFQQASNRINDPGMQLGQQTTSALDKIYPMQSLSATSTDIQNMFNFDQYNTQNMFNFDQYNTQSMLDFGTYPGIGTDLTGFSGATE